MIRRTLVPLVILAAVWWILAGSEAWLLGAAAVGAGLALHVLLGGGEQGGARLSRLPGFIHFFAWQSVRGGWDVSRRALTPTLRLEPELVTHPLTLPSGPSRIFFTNALSLLPGTFGADIRGDELVVHLLVTGPHAAERTRELERRVARLFEVAGP